MATLSARAEIIARCTSMRVGDCITIPAPEQGAFSGDGMHASDERDDLLRALPGSSWGAWTVAVDAGSAAWTVCRHEPGERRVYVELPRRHLFEAMPDGTLRLR